MLREACQTIKRNRAQFLARHTTQDIINMLAQVAAGWLEPANPFRKLALEQGPAETGFSAPVIGKGLDFFFRELTPQNFKVLLEQDLGHALRLDGMAWTEAELKSRRAAMARAPELLVHITAGSLPNPALMSIVLGFLTRSAQIIKCAREASFLPRLFAHSIYEAQPKLGSCLEVAEWHGGNTQIEKVVFEEADCVTVTGSDQTLAEIQKRLPAGKRFLGYGHRVSFAFISSGSLAPETARTAARLATEDIATWDQWGCLSPHVIYVEAGGWTSPEEFAGILAEELEAREKKEPRGRLVPTAAATIASRRSFYELRAAHSNETRLWCSPGSTAWTVVYETDPTFQLSCLNRFVYVKRAPNLEQALRGADVVRTHVSTVGAAAPEDKLPGLAAELAAWGATRVCPVGRMQRPPLTWRHDGRPALADLVSWTDWEQT
jgi:hypothetical protein